MIALLDEGLLTAFTVTLVRASGVPEIPKPVLGVLAQHALDEERVLQVATGALIAGGAP